MLTRLLAFVLVVALAAACSGDDASESTTTDAGTEQTDPSSTESATTEKPTTTADPARACVDALPIDVAIGQIPLLLVSPDADVTAFDGSIGGVVLVEHHDAGSVSSLRAQLDGFAIRGMLASDEEGGRVQRVRSVLGDLPSAARIATMSSADAAAVYADYATGLAGLGIDVNLAPVLDTGSAALGDRSYGSDPALVTAAATLYVEALVGAGVFPVVKHFPGLGSASAHTDEAEATGPPLDQLRQRDLVPYEALADRDDTIGVMMSHVAVPDVTGDAPTSLSPAMYDLLRDEIGFDGFVVTDSLTAGATVGDLGGAVVGAVAAGADMTAFSNPANVPVAVEALRAAVADGRVSEARARDAAAAVLDVKGVDPCSVAG